jgi:5-methylcytosine-specific restriction endonuclease McrA
MAQALVLNATFEPLSVVPIRRALVLLVRDKAELVHSRDRVWRSEHVDFAEPAVIRLRRYVRVPYHRRVALSRRAVFARDRACCQYCGRKAENLDHVLPRSRGGGHTWENVVAACRRCNARKGDRTPPEAGMTLRSSPRAPRRVGWLVIGLGGSLDPSWHEYLGAAAS